MRQFASSGFRIWNLSREAKLVYTCFGLFSLCGILSSIALYDDSAPGGGARAASAYYRGGAPATGTRPAPPPAPSTNGPTQGPALDLPEEPIDARPITVAVPYRKLLEVTHFHLFTVPVFLLIVAHLFMLTGLSSRAKTIWIAAAWLSALAHLVAPWLVRYAGAGWSYAFVASGVAFAVTATALTVYPIVTMWRSAPRRRDGSDGDQPSPSSPSSG